MGFQVHIYFQAPPGHMFVEDKKRNGIPRIYEEAEFEVLLDEGLGQTQEEVALI